MMLAHYLERAAGQRFAFGTADCATFVLDWVALNRGADPGRDVRGWHSGTAAADILARFGGLLPALRQVFEADGLRPILHPGPGDVGVVSFGRPVGAICAAPGRWAARGRRGLIIAPAICLAAWSLT